MVDGRYVSQKKNMLAWQNKFAILNINTQVIYLVEGHTKKYVAKCQHGCMVQCGVLKIGDVEVSWQTFVSLHTI